VVEVKRSWSTQIGSEYPELDKSGVLASIRSASPPLPAKDALLGLGRRDPPSDNLRWSTEEDPDDDVGKRLAVTQSVFWEKIDEFTKSLDCSMTPGMDLMQTMWGVFGLRVKRWRTLGGCRNMHSIKYTNWRNIFFSPIYAVTQNHDYNSATICLEEYLPGLQLYSHT
jgi:hypothetical protein